MAKNKVEIEVGANVQGAVTGLENLNDSLKNLPKRIGGVELLSAQFERLQRIASLPNLSTAKQEKINSLLLKGQSDLNKYIKAQELANASTGKLANSSGQATTALTNLGRVASDAPFGFIAISNNIDPLIQSFVQLKKESGSTAGALKALVGGLAGGGGLALAFSLATSALTLFSLSQRGANKEIEKGKSETDSYVNNLTKQKTEVLALVNVVNNQTLAERDRNAALDRLNQILPDSIGKLTRANIATAQGVNIIRQYVKAIEARATAELLINRISENNIKLFDNRNRVLAGAEKFEASILKLRERAEQLRSRNQFEQAATVEAQILTIQQQSAKALQSVRAEQQAILDDNQRLRDQYEKILPTAIQLEKVTTSTSVPIKNIAQDAQATSAAFFDLTEAAKKYRAELIGINQDPSIFVNNRPEPRVNINRAGNLSIPVLTPEALQKTAEYGRILDEITAKYQEQQALLKTIGDTVTGAIGGGIDTLFNALANNQDPLEALRLSVKRLVVELAAAVVKALALKAITAAFSGGSSLALSSLTGAGGDLRSVLRGRELLTLFGRG